MALVRSPEFFEITLAIFFFFPFRQEFTRISLCLYSASNPHSLIPCLLTDQNFKTVFEKGHSRNISMKLFQNMTSSFREDGFLRICSCLYGESSHVHGLIKIWLPIFEKGHSRNVSVNWGLAATDSVVLISSTGRRPASYCHGVVTSCVRPSVRPCVCP